MPRTHQKSKRPSAKRRLDFGDDHEQDDNSVVVLEQETKRKSHDKEDSKVSPFFIPATPEKKRRRRDSKQGISTYFSPLKTTDANRASVVVTPEKTEDAEIDEIPTEKSSYVPIYIHKNLNYQRRGHASINVKLKRFFELVEEHYVIPPDFESNRSYGPLSGTCFEERTVNAYEKSLLSPKKTSKTGEGIPICTFCGTVGHEQDECPDLI